MQNNQNNKFNLFRFLPTSEILMFKNLDYVMGKDLIQTFKTFSTFTKKYHVVDIPLDLQNG